LAKVRKRLRAEHRFPRGTKNKFGIDAVFSTEPLRFPEPEEACAIDDEERTGVTGLNCAGFGSAMVVTAAFGLVAASHVLNKLAASAEPEIEKTSLTPENQPL
jgi:tRNA A37 threonylcarbamoyladenosine dehydratase